MAPLVRHISTNHHGSYCILDIKSCKKKPLDDFGEIISATKTAKKQKKTLGGLQEYRPDNHLAVHAATPRPYIIHCALCIIHYELCIVKPIGCLAQLLHCLHQQRSRRAHIQSHVAIAGHPIYLAIVQGEMCLIGKESHQLGVVKPQTTTIEPHQE